MSVALLLISHEGIGVAIHQAAKRMYGHAPLKTAVMCVPLDEPPDQVQAEAAAMIEHLDEGDGVLVLTDLFGATPANIAHCLLPGHPIRIVSGLNLPMLARIYNYASDNLNDLTEKAIEGGQRGITEQILRSCE